MRINSFTIGADPELFIINKRTGKVVSSIGLIPGEKGNPWVGEDMPKGFGLEIDNILAEFNIPPVKNWEGFVNNIQYMKDYIAKFVANKNPDLGIKCIASQKVDSDQLQSEEAQLFGCDPDFNAYTQMENPKPKGNTTNLRSAGQKERPENIVIYRRINQKRKMSLDNVVSNSVLIRVIKETLTV